MAGDLFRGLFPFLDDKRDYVVAMPMISTGNQGFRVEAMAAELLTAAAEWLRRGLPIRELMIVDIDADKVRRLNSEFNAFVAAHASVQQPAPQARSDYDWFVSYSSTDVNACKIVHEELTRYRPEMRIFDFKREISIGSAWQSEIDRAISGCARIAAILSPAYFASAECREELMMARLVNKRSNGSILRPYYWRTIEEGLDLWIQAISYRDCREANEDGLRNELRSEAARRGLVAERRGDIG